MTRIKYGEIWTEVIEPAIKKIIKNKDIRLVYEMNFLKEKIYEDYEKIKSNVHTYMADPQGKIDRHKIAASFILVLRNVRPFELVIKSAKDKLPVKFYLVNELLALQTGLSIVYSFIMDNSDKKTREIFEHGFKFPICEHDNYFNYLLQELYYAFQVNKCFDVFTYSNLLFMIEEYTKAVLR